MEKERKKKEKKTNIHLSLGYPAGGGCTLYSMPNNNTASQTR